ncbi:periplasmic nitrate reductase, NapE protein [Shewanella sp. NIFS-20-20]|uniref:periplasmic nitrate reductase, NapE protein n=1 Tax=Shewanella sp. NIFS-20-20 TaxID=2853806 RepID=UPI001C43EEFC|nr:periplasmic nitrate reductase, NapE protein [Shewanella sp. NIFS-20-20]MBV7314944.1 periplasmic nitrate reductase, NapE protein [Shewanella sp. NIFS-20-20]
MTNTPKNQDETTRASELKAMGFIVVILFPLLTIGLISAYGFFIWFYQTFYGIPGH